jgi:hypothetical protein
MRGTLGHLQSLPTQARVPCMRRHARHARPPSIPSHSSSRASHSPPCEARSATFNPFPLKLACLACAIRPWRRGRRRAIERRPEWRDGRYTHPSTLVALSGATASCLAPPHPARRRLARCDGPRARVGQLPRVARDRQASEVIQRPPLRGRSSRRSTREPLETATS